MKNKKKTKKATGKSYLKIIGCMAIGAAIGAVTSILGMFGYEAVGNGTVAFVHWLGAQTIWIMPAMLLGTIIEGIICLRLEKSVRQEAQRAEELDEDMGDMDDKLNWCVAVVGSLNYAVIFLGMLLLIINADMSMGGWGPYELIGIVAAYLLAVLLQSALQVRMVKLVQSIDPMKQGDPGSLSFQKQWLAGCDEAERQMLYQAAYQTYQFLNPCIMVLLVLAVLCHLVWGTGLLAVAMLAILGFLQGLVYQICALRLQKKKLRG